MPDTTAELSPRLIASIELATAKLIAGAGDGRDLLTTEEAAKMLCLRPKTLEMGRNPKFGKGPIGLKFIKLSPHCVRYRRSDILDYMRACVLRENV